eukprot:COSAG04_NODE_17791_length_459_cov_0.538889_1_plen_59_part_01
MRACMQIWLCGSDLWDRRTKAVGTIESGRFTIEPYILVAHLNCHAFRLWRSASAKLCIR